MRKFQTVGILLALSFNSSGFAVAPFLVLDLRTIDPAPSVLTRIYGRGLENDGDHGVPVAGGYDCDGDGHLDSAFAQIQGDPFGRIDAGEVTLVFGN